MDKDKRGQKKKRIGIVISDKMDKTRTVQIKRLVKHDLYSRYVLRKSKLMAHDEGNISHAGDKVILLECRPISKNKRWRVIKKLGETQAAME